MGHTINNRLCPQVRGMSYYVKAKENVSASVEIFKAISSPPFSSPAKLRPINSNLWILFSVNMSFKVKMSFKTLNELCSIGARRPRRPGSLEGRFRKAKSSMWLRHSPWPFVRFCFPPLGTKPKIKIPGICFPGGLTKVSNQVFPLKGAFRANFYFSSIMET